MPAGTVSATGQMASAKIMADAFSLTVGDLEPGTLFRVKASFSGRLFVKSGNGLGASGRLLKNRYNGDAAPIAIVVPSFDGDNRAWTPATTRMDAETVVISTHGVLSIDLNG